jgi:hypothetical protein
VHGRAPGRGLGAGGLMEGRIISPSAGGSGRFARALRASQSGSPRRAGGNSGRLGQPRISRSGGPRAPDTALPMGSSRRERRRTSGCRLAWSSCRASSTVGPARSRGARRRVRAVVAMHAERGETASLVANELRHHLPRTSSRRISEPATRLGTAATSRRRSGRELLDRTMPGVGVIARNSGRVDARAARAHWLAWTTQCAR